MSRLLNHIARLAPRKVADYPAVNGLRGSGGQRVSSLSVCFCGAQHRAWPLVGVLSRILHLGHDQRSQRYALDAVPLLHI